MRFVRLRAREGVELVDPLAAKLAEIGQDCTGEGVHDVPLFLGLENVFARRFATDAEFKRALMAAYDAVGDDGSLSAV
jgi:fructuronate reductase